MIQVDKYTNLELALLGVLGYLGNGTKRKELLGERYTQVQPLINDICKGIIPVPTDDMTKEEALEGLKKALLELEPTHKDYLDYVALLIETIEKEGYK